MADAVGRFHWLVIDTVDPDAIAPFWCALLGVEQRGWFADDYLMLTRNESTPPVAFQRVPEGKSVKNRLHLDLRSATSMAEEKARVLGLGAREFRYVEEGGSFWTVMLDPEGNEFCVLRGPEDGWSPE